MIWQLVKRDPAWRGALYFAAAGAILCRILPPEFIGMFGMVVAMCWFRSQPNVRATLFQAGLPIHVRDLFLARILSLFAGAWLPVAGGAALMLLAGKPAQDAAIVVEIGAAFSVLALVMQSSRVRAIDGSEWAYVLVAIGWAAGALISHFVPPAVVLAICAVLCPLLFWNIWRQLPTAFEVAPADLTRQRSSQGSAAPPAFIWWPTLRSLFPLRSLLFLPMLVLMPLGGQWIYVTVFCIFPVMASVTQTPWALTLPVRRGALLAVSLLPWMAVLLLGVLLGNRFGTKPSIRLEWSASHEISDIRPPLEFWRTGEAPLIRSPWGESWRPASQRLDGVAIYNPYSLGPASSARFAHWQFRRATEAVYGDPVDYPDFERYRQRLRPLTHQARLAILNLAACAAVVMLLCNIAFGAMHWRFRRVIQAQEAAGWLLAVPTFCILLIDWSPASHWAGPVGMSLINALLLRVSALLPAGLPAVVLAGGLPVALLSWTASRLFRGVEIPPPPVAARP